MPSSTPGNVNMTPPKDKPAVRKNDAQQNAAERVARGTDKSALPVAEQHAGQDCDSAPEDE